GGLREKELTYGNSMTLHEHYFANLGGDGKPDGPVTKALGEVFGSQAKWEELFRATGGSLGGGSGWTVLSYHLHTDDLRIDWSGGHPVNGAFARPLLVLDMYEHAYQMDYGAAAAKYIDAFFRNVKWEEVNRRYEQALRLAKAMKA
ncbi:MAG: superoxide dismutase, partial [Candidatus Methylomirabilis sp.]|nr:superoxide dismutase [Deltaproteobacteria bacterium]